MKAVLTIALSMFAVFPAVARQQPDASNMGVTMKAPRLIPEDLHRQPFTFAERPTVVPWAADGDTLLTGILRYGYEAHLEAPFTVQTHFGPMRFEGDERFYGIPFPRPAGAMFGTGLQGIAYCSPFIANGRSIASCLLLFEKQPLSATQVDREAYLADRVGVNFNSSTTGALRLSVDRDPGFPGIDVRVRLLRWSDSKLQFTSEAVKDGTVVSAIKSSVPLRKGVATVSFGRGVLRFEGLGQNRRVSVLSAPEAEDSIIPVPMR